MGLATVEEVEDVVEVDEVVCWPCLSKLDELFDATRLEPEYAWYEGICVDAGGWTGTGGGLLVGCGI